MVVNLRFITGSTAILCNLATASPNCRQSSRRIQTGYVHNYSMTGARILGNDCPKFGKLLQDCVKSLYYKGLSG